MGLQVGINRPVGCKTGIKKPTLCSAGCGDCRCQPHRALLLWRIHLTLRQVGMDSQTQLKMWRGLFMAWLGLSIARMMVGSLKMGNSVFRLPTHSQRQPETYPSSAIAITLSGVNFVMQSKCPSGHSRLKHGLQSKLSVAIFALSLNGGVCSGLDEP